MRRRMAEEMVQPRFADVDRRLALAFGALVMALMVTVLVVAGMYLKGVMDRQEDKLSTLLTQVLAKAVSRVSFSGKYHARLLLEEIRAEHPGIRYLRIVDADGNVLAHSDPDQNGRLLPPEEIALVRQVLTQAERQVRQVVWQSESLLEVSLPYQGGYGDAPLGAIQVGLSHQERDAALSRGLLYIALVVLALLAVSVLAVRRISQHFGAPVKRLADDMAATLMAIPDLLFELDHEGRYLQVLTHKESLLAASRARLLGHTIHEMLPPQAAATVQSALDEARELGESHGQQIALPLESGLHWFELSVARKQGGAGEAPSYIVLSRDISERHQAQAQLLLAGSVFDNAREGILITGRDRRILRVNPAFLTLTGYGEEEILMQTPALLRSGHHDKAFYEEMGARLETQGHWQGEVWDRRKDGQVIPLLLSISAVRDTGGQTQNYVAVFTDISRIKQSEERLEYLAHHDPLTGLANRLMLHTRLEHVLEQARREHRSVALLMLDLDRFKDVNDSFGHAMGDALLQEVARRLGRRVRQADTVSRIGGDEFTILMESLVHPDDAARLAEDVVTMLRDPVRLPNGKEVVVGASVGIALFPDHASSEETLLQQADAALYQAKAEGRGRYKYFTDALTRAARERLEMESRLRGALQKGELRLHYQPQVDIASGRIIGAEALVRWQDPVEGMVPPGRFIPLAEHTGLIEAIGNWVLLEACSQAQRWREAGLPPIQVAVNLSPHQFRSGHLVEQVDAILARTGLPAQTLELELTESALMEEHALATLTTLRSRGIRLAIDDFGTGYSSLSYLKRFPLDQLKIDKSFVDDIPGSQDDREIAATIIAMAHTLRLQVLAEGVETPAQLAFLEAKGCDCYQGYLKSRPLPPQEFQALLETDAVQVAVSPP
jgi:diguanylate cyclase (GGDEF)-like protein/PAS domain S-box-containing protein